MGLKIVKRYGGQAGWAVKDATTRKYIKQSSWPAGLTPELTLEQARHYVKALNRSRRPDVERARALAKQADREAVKSAYLPPLLVAEFEKNLLSPDLAPKTKGKRALAWDHARRIIAWVGQAPSEWAAASGHFWAYFEAHPCTHDWGKRVLDVLNKYGRLYARKEKSFFEPLLLGDSWRWDRLEVGLRGQRRSLPLELEDLKRLRGKIPEGNFGWLWVAFWFLLRPEEADGIQQGGFLYGRIKMERWFQENRGSTVVCYQPKLRKLLPIERRYKRVPVMMPEQFEALEIIRTTTLVRPKDREARKWLPAGVTNYGCRSGGANHFLFNLDIPRADVSHWMGHQSLATTEKFYLALQKLKKPTPPGGS